MTFARYYVLDINNIDDKINLLLKNFYRFNTLMVRHGFQIILNLWLGLTTERVEVGIPQDSILDPILFSGYNYTSMTTQIKLVDVIIEIPLD